MENLIISQMVKDLLEKFEKKGLNKISYNYAYPVVFDFGAGTQNITATERVTISNSQVFIFQDVLFNSTGDFDILFKDASTGRELSQSAINSQVLSYKNFAVSQYKGLWRFPIPKIMDGSSEIFITVTNLSASANKVILNINGVSINDR